VTIEPGASTGWHTHPGPEYSVVKTGEIVLERSPACAPVTVKAGEGSFIPGGMPHIAHNHSTAPAEIYVTYTVPAGTTHLRPASPACSPPRPSPTSWPASSAGKRSGA